MTPREDDIATPPPQGGDRDDAVRPHEPERPRTARGPEATTEPAISGVLPEAGTEFAPESDPRADAGAAIEHPLREMLRIATPSVVTMTSYTAMQFIDALMVSRIEPPSPTYVAAQGNGGIAAWMPIAFAFGLFAVVNTYVSQNLGAGRPRRGAAYAWSALWLAAGFQLLLIPYLLALPAIFQRMGHSPELTRMESRYAQVILAGAFFVMASRGLANYFYGMHRAWVVMLAALAAHSINVVANMLLIFGAEGLPPTGVAAFDAFGAAMADVAQGLGVPALGVTGAALGTVIGSSIELLLPLAVFLSPAMARRFGTRDAWRPAVEPIADIWRIGWPGAAMFANEMFCWTFLTVFLLAFAARAAGEDPTVHTAAGWIALRYMHVSFMPAVGLSIAVTALVGKCMGMARPELAERRAWLGLGITLAYMGLCAAAFVIWRREAIELFAPRDLGPEQLRRLIDVGAAVMIAAAVFQLFDATAIVTSAALRGAGDTVWPGVVTIVLSWACIVGLGTLMVVVAPGLGSIGPWIGAAAFIISLGTLLLLRFVRGGWREMRLVRHDDAVPQAPGVSAA